MNAIIDVTNDSNGMTLAQGISHETTNRGMQMIPMMAHSMPCRSAIRILLVLALLCPLMLLTSITFAGTTEELSLYLSADRTGTRASGISIEQGIRTALAENGNRLGGFKVSLKILDHHGSTPRARKHLEMYLQDPTALALFSGLHSPPLLATREFINKQRILVLDPWAAAGPITRYPSEQNWIFRLSIDDSKAGHVITRHAVERRGIKQPALLLEQTGWGKSNQRTMTQALKDQGLFPATLKWLNWGLTEESARILLRQIAGSDADAIFLVANAPEGKVIAKAMVSLPEAQRLPIFSHWGITGGDFSETIGPQMRKQLQLEFIQTSFSFLSKLSPFQQRVLNQARKQFPEIIKQPVDIKAATGFIHAYDLTRILIAAAEQAELSGDILKDRMALRDTLEMLNAPIQGLIKTYRTPFRRFTEADPDAHEALEIEDFTMGYYGRNNEIILITP